MERYASLPNCDRCGRFVRPSAPGVSWCTTYSGYELNDPTYRCSSCTDKHGVEQSNCNPLSGPWQGRNPEPPPRDLAG